jgi:hypothetical protein
MILSDFHKDHICHLGSNKIDNCVPACKSCNSQKWEYQFNDWYNEQNEKYSYKRYEKILKWINGDYKITERNKNEWN